MPYLQIAFSRSAVSVPLCLCGSLLIAHRAQPEPGIVIAHAALVPVAIGGTQILAAVIPRAATQHPTIFETLDFLGAQRIFLWARGVVPGVVEILAPFVD